MKIVYKNFFPRNKNSYRQLTAGSRIPVPAPFACREPRYEPIFRTHVLRSTLGLNVLRGFNQH